MENNHTEETKKSYSDTITTFVEHLNKKLEKSGKPFMCGDKVTIGDFQVCAVVFNFIENSELGGGAEYSDKGKEIIMANAAFSAYTERMKTELKSYLENRGKAPF